MNNVMRMIDMYYLIVMTVYTSKTRCQFRTCNSSTVSTISHNSGGNKSPFVMARIVTLRVSLLCYYGPCGITEIKRFGTMRKKRVEALKLKLGCGLGGI
jgi:hypothetical protein